MLNSQIIRKINDFVYTKPRTVDEIAKHIGKNWRTANRYIERISEEQGTISLRVFREGTKGALKIVSWNNIERIHSTSFQEKLLAYIESGKKKNDFSPFDIYQHVAEKKKSAFIKEGEEESITPLQDLVSLLRKTEKNLFIFSGNLSWANLVQDNTKLIGIFEELARRNVSIKIVTRVELAGLDNIKKVLAINDRIGREIIEIRHREQPLRAVIIDNKLAQFREIKNPEDYKKNELNKKTFFFYNIYDSEWVEWLQKVFWNMFSTAVPAEKRIKEIDAIRKL
jgi:hypothetical protein